MKKLITGILLFAIAGIAHATVTMGSLAPSSLVANDVDVSTLQSNITTEAEARALGDATVQSNVTTHAEAANNPHNVTASQTPYFTRPIYDTESIPDPGADPVQVGTQTNFVSESLDDLFYQAAMRLPRAGGTVGSLHINGQLRIGDYAFVGEGNFHGVNLVPDGHDLGIQNSDGEVLLKFSSGRLAFTIISLVVTDNTATILIDGSNLLDTPTIEVTTNLVDGVWTNAGAVITGPVAEVYTATVDVSGYTKAFFRAIGVTVRGNSMEAKAPIMSVKQPGEEPSIIRLYSYATNMTPDEAIADETLRVLRVWNDHGTPRIDLRPQGSSNLTVQIDSGQIKMPVMVMIPQSTVPPLVVGGFYVSSAGSLYICRSLITGWELFQ